VDARIAEVAADLRDWFGDEAASVALDLACDALTNDCTDDAGLLAEVAAKLLNPLIPTLIVKRPTA
jgi:predicted membrane chloride channel (bestrophin family)